MNNENIDREFGWDDTIENDSPDMVTLPEGEYEFEVVDFERGRHGGSDKLPPCNKAVVHFRVTSPEGVSQFKNNFFLHSKTEGILCSFFTAIGQRKKGEQFTMNWNAIIGARGRCRLGIREYNGNTYNEIKRFLEPDGTAAPASSSPKGFQPGKF